MTERRGLQLAPAILLAALSIGTLCPAAEPDADWPQWRYDAARSAACPHELPDTLHLQWVRRYPPTTPAWPDQNRLHFDTEYRPVIMDGSLFLGSPRADWVAAVDVATGREQWRTYTGGPVRFAPAAAHGRLYVGSDDGYLYCLDADDGSVVWRRAMSPRAGRQVLGNKRLISTWPVRGGPALAGGRLYVAAGIWPWMGVFIRAVDPKTGETIWCNSGSGSKLRGQPHCGHAFTGPAPQGAIAVVGDRVLVPNGRAVAACFDAGTGALRHFRYGATRADGSYFVAASERYYFNRKVVFGVETGTRFRRIPGTPVVGDGVL
ncbi:MAG: PQQ-binding-like beta-propeller repeat protein, partial [Planctomycetota bacterium]